jgi:DNA-binding NarL/FixJ family response regulator
MTYPLLIRQQGSPAFALSAMQSKVLRLCSLGCAVKDIAPLLGLSASTVDNYKTRAMTRARVRNLAELTRFAIRTGISSMSDALIEEKPCLDPLLSVRQRATVRLASLGLTVKEIARVLYLRPATVGNHKARAMARANVHNLPELTRFAIRAGISLLTDLTDDERHDALAGVCEYNRASLSINVGEARGSTPLLASVPQPCPEEAHSSTRKAAATGQK